MPRFLSRLTSIILLALATISVCAAQTLEPEADGRVQWRVSDPQELDSIGGQASTAQEALRQALQRMERIGFLNARIADHRQRGDELQIGMMPGDRVTIRDLRLDEVSGVGDALAEQHLLRLSGEPLDHYLVAAHQRAVIEDLARRGRPLARLTLREVSLDETESAADLEFELDLGERAILTSIIVSDDSRISPRLVSLLTGLPMGRELASYDPIRILTSLERSGYVQHAAIRGLEHRADGLHLHLDVTDAAPGSFDLVFGYLPESQGGGGFVGSGHVHLVNPFGGGREFAARLDRMPGQASRFEASVFDPFVAGTALTLALEFAGVQQDSLFNRLTYRIEPGVTLAPGFSLYGTASREQVRPGLAGTAIVGDRQRIARSDLTLFGAGVRFRTVDNPLLPRTGLVLDLRAERGRSQRTLARVIDGEVRTDVRGLPFQRLSGSATQYFALGARQVLRAGLNVGSVLSEEVDRADLLRVGGARSLRGYDEDRFLVRSVVRGSIELRHILDSVSYLYIFADGAYLERPSSRDLDSIDGAYFGFGAGTRFDAGFGLLNVSLAVNPTDGPAAPRIHAGVAFAL